MSAGYDGSISFSTAIDSKGFNSGIKRISGSLNGVMAALSKGLKAVAGIAIGVATAIVGVIAGLVGAVLAIFAWAQKFTTTLTKTLSQTSAYRDQVIQLKTAFDTLKGSVTALGTTLLTALAPTLMKIIDWLVKAINYVSMFIAAMSGQKTVMQYVSGTAEGAANSVDKLAKNTKKAGEAAAGALAGFDQLNVLQMEEPQEESGGEGGGAGGNIVMQAVDIDPKILETVEKIKTWFKDAWENVSGWAIRAWNDITFYLAIAWAWIEVYIIKPLVEGFNNAWAWVKQAAIDAWTWISGVWAKVSEWFKTNVIDPLVNFFTPIFRWIGIVAYDAWLVIKAVWGIVAGWFNTNVIEPIKKFFTTVWEWVKTKASDAWTKVIEIWGKVKAWFTEHVTDPIKDAFKTALDWVKTKFETIFTGIKDFVKGIINGLIDLLNGMLRGAVNGLNNLIGVANSVGGSLPGWKTIPSITAPQIPHLATGAVIPPNSQFLAVLGDQRSGRNIETPEALMRQIVREEMEGSGGQQKITVDFGNSTLGALIRTLNPVIKQETDRMGSSLLNGAS